MTRQKRFGVYFIFKSLEQGPKFGIRVPTYPTDDPAYRIVTRQRCRYTHYYFYIRDEVLGPFAMCVGSFLPFQTTYYLNGHHIIAGELQRRGVRVRTDDNAFLCTSNLEALQAAADRLDPEVIRQRLEYWTLVLGPKFSKKDRAAINLRRAYSLNQQTHRARHRACHDGTCAPPGIFSYAAVSSFTTLDGELVPGRTLSGDLGCEIGGYVIKSRRTAAWDAIVELLMFLDAEHSQYFRRLMRGCVRLSNGTREPDGFHNVLQDEDQNMFDLASVREARREKQGYVTPAQARAFLQAGRPLELDGDPPPVSPVAQAYFRSIESTPPPEGDAARGPAGTLRGSGLDLAPEIEPDAIAAVVELLREAGAITASPRALLDSGEQKTSRFVWIRTCVESHAASAEELAYLANTLIAGCSIQARAFTAQEGSDAAPTICNLGLENWPHHWPDQDLITAFQVGWTVLYRDVCLFTAERLIDIVADIRCTDRDIQLRLNALQRELKQHVRDRAPWRARDALEVIVMLDAPSWAALCALIDECPVIHAAVGASERRDRSISAADFEFIGQNSQIAAAREFLQSLPSALTRQSPAQNVPHKAPPPETARRRGREMPDAESASG